MEQVSDLLAAAREAYARRDWAGARDRLNAVRERESLSADDLFLLGDAAWWLGLVDESLSASEAAYRLYLQGSDHRRAAMSAIAVAVNLFLRGDDEVGSGWISRAQRILDDEPEGVEHGYIVYVTEVEGGLDGTDLDGVIASARRVQRIGRVHDDPDLVAVGLLGEGRAVIRQGDVSRGMALLDEAMIGVVAEEVSPDWAGNIYCHLMALCWELQDIRRAATWVEATAEWLKGLPAAVVFTGVCRVHRTQILHLQGAWDRAEAEALLVASTLDGIHTASAAECHYALGEIRRLRGDETGAEAAFRMAHERGRDPEPGLALLRLAQGRTSAATASVRAALAANPGRLARPRLLAAQVEIALAAGDVETAESAAAELEDSARVYRTSGLQACALVARGAVLLAQGHADQALAILRRAATRWRDINAPYERARTRVLLARAYRELGDDDHASLEMEAARSEFEHLGAVVDARRIAGWPDSRTRPGGLTSRETEVVALIATGMTNREVADALVLSEKTVARHLSNIFDKLGVSSRTEAAAFAFENDLVPRGRTVGGG